MKTVCKTCGSEDVSVTVAVNPNDTTTITDYCHRDETITEDGWCNRCCEYVDLETTNIKVSENPWRCGKCGSTAVQERVWRDVNTEKIADAGNCDRADYYCNNCEGHNRLERESELLRRAADWWGETDFREMERVTRYRQLDFDPDEGWQAFVDACNEWWNGKTTDEKISIYLNNR